LSRECPLGRVPVLPESADRFPRPFLVLSAAEYRRFVATLPEHGVFGGAGYDALVAETARAVATLDRRASGVYERYGVEVVHV